MEITDLLLKFEFCSEGDKQKILVDVLLKYSDFNIQTLSQMLETTPQTLRAVHSGESFFTGQKAHDLSHFFLIFFGRKFFKKFSVIRRYVD